MIFLLLSLASWITQHPATTITLCTWAFLPFAFGTGHTWTSPWEVFVGVFVRILEALHDPARGQVVKCGRRQVYISIEMLQRVGWSRNYAPAGEFLFAMGQKITLKSKRCIHTHWKETQISMQDATVSISWISQAHIISIGDYSQGALVTIQCIYVGIGMLMNVQKTKQLSEICIIGTRQMNWFSDFRDIIRKNMSSQPTAKTPLGFHLKKLQSCWGSEPSNWSKDCWMAFCSYHHPQLESRHARKHDVLVMSRYQSYYILKVWINVKSQEPVSDTRITVVCLLIWFQFDSIFFRHGWRLISTILGRHFRLLIHVLVHGQVLLVNADQ